MGSRREGRGDIQVEDACPCCPCHDRDPWMTSPPSHPSSYPHNSSPTPGGTLRNSSASWSPQTSHPSRGTGSATEGVVELVVSQGYGALVVKVARKARRQYDFSPCGEEERMARRVVSLAAYGLRSSGAGTLVLKEDTR